jgi:3-deoxy-7-phosphoheptulonate synthase
LEFGGKKIIVMAGACAVENENFIEIAKIIKDCGADVLRGGIFKPRSSPDRWDGLKEEGLEILKEAKRVSGLPLVSEAMSLRQIEFLYDVVDIFQIGTRNMQSSELLREFGRQDKPVLLKRGMATTIEEFIMAADFIRCEGNPNVILCERGIRTFETYTRNTFDINCIPAVKNLCEIPIIADTSHGTGVRELVIPIAMGAIAAGADGLMIEVHNKPEEAKTDGGQSLTPEMFKDAMKQFKKVAEAVGRCV